MKLNHLKLNHYSSDPWKRPEARKSKRKERVILPAHVQDQKNKKSHQLKESLAKKFKKDAKHTRWQKLLGSAAADKFFLKNYAKSTDFDTAFDTAYGTGHGKFAGFIHDDYITTHPIPTGKSFLKIQDWETSTVALDMEANPVYYVVHNSFSYPTSYYGLRQVDAEPTIEERALAMVKEKPAGAFQTDLMVEFAQQEVKESQTKYQKRIDYLTNYNYEQNEKIMLLNEHLEVMGKRVQELEVQIEKERKQRATIREHSITITERVRHFREED